jgi:hypothetical protein
MRHCPDCGSEFQDWLKQCLDCGADLKDGPAPEKADETAKSPYEEMEEWVEEPGEQASAGGENLSDLEIDPEEVLTPKSEYEIEGDENDFPYKDLVSVDISPNKTDIYEKMIYLRDAGLEAYLFSKQYFWSASFELLVHSEQAEKASQLLESFKPASLIEIEAENTEENPTVSNDLKIPEPSAELPLLFKNIPEDEEAKKDRVIKCTICGSQDLEYKTSLFSSKVKLKCRNCGNKWQEDPGNRK